MKIVCAFVCELIFQHRPNTTSNALIYSNNLFSLSSTNVENTTIALFTAIRSIRKKCPFLFACSIDKKKFELNLNFNLDHCQCNATTLAYGKFLLQFNLLRMQLVLITLLLKWHQNTMTIALVKS